MKRIASALVLCLIVSSFSLALLTVAETEGPSANGSYQVSIGNGPLRAIRFNAKARDGSTTGEITFRDDGVVTNATRTNSNAEATDLIPAFYARASCDCLIVKGVEAALSGTIIESSQEDLIGRRVLLVVQDGDSLNPPLRDKLTFGFYKTITKSWIASDAERPDEQGSTPAWIATDAERPEDSGILSQKSDQITCESFPFLSHMFLTAKQGKGQIQVTR